MRRNVVRLAEVEAQAAPLRRNLYLSPEALFWLAASFAFARITASPFTDPERYFSSVVQLLSIFNVACMVTALTGSGQKPSCSPGILLLGFGMFELEFFASVAGVYAAITTVKDIIESLREISPALDGSRQILLGLEKFHAGDIDFLSADNLAEFRESVGDDDEIRASLRAFASDDKIAAAQEEVRRNYLRLVELSELLEAEVERYKEDV
ncbi:uncharacterized protein LOC62_07G008980 [Vanrija pseudolonga]|uniref:Uncharacterized protein n=1 Tax=Vanrija pseudolonga TaxID=143232 RepID=A0AAF1BL64_9TREE|nr:hypothetical protein LOC62_07G008980 [Vanrija pseudolonga]